MAIIHNLLGPVPRMNFKGTNRISRFHDEKGNFVDIAGVPNAIPAFCSAAAKRLFGYRAKVPMISYRARQVIDNFLTPETQMIEFGSGNSTPWFAERVGKLISIEDQLPWFEHTKSLLKDRQITNVQYEFRPDNTYTDLSSIKDNSIDFALIDGTDREGCIFAVTPKVKAGGVIYLDNSDKDMLFPDGDLRRAEKALRLAVENRAGTIRLFSDFSPTNFFVEQGILAQF